MEKNEIIRWLREYDGRPVKIMEVCGTHTSALYKTGLPVTEDTASVGAGVPCLCDTDCIH